MQHSLRAMAFPQTLLCIVLNTQLNFPLKQAKCNTRHTCKTCKCAKGKDLSMWGKQQKKTLPGPSNFGESQCTKLMKKDISQNTKKKMHK